MALTPAEKQRRYRTRLRERLAVADEALHPDDFRELRDSWQAEKRAMQQEINFLRRALESAGVELTNGDQPGVRLRKVDQ